ncbi:MAG TPA: DinB family protein [Cytophagaceae bacterium]|jgi:hypothetical protein|nr:DinB family protein [Cytophagaceae bacterium]
MNKEVEKIKRFRLWLLAQINGLTTEQLNKIPSGYHNNIIWNLGHMMAAQQTLCYKRAQQAITIGDKYFSPFLSSTKPDQYINTTEVEVIKELFIRSIDQLQEDLEKKLFNEYTKATRIEDVYGIEVSTIEDALSYLLYHEGIHSGYVLRMKDLLL